MGFNIDFPHPSDRLPRVRRGYYRHYKGGDYKVLSMARHSETGEWMVVYRSFHRGKLWVRPLVEWHRPMGEGSPWTADRFSRLPFWAGFWQDLAYNLLWRWVIGS